MGISAKSKNFIQPWLIWALAAFFFFAHYVVRVTPGQLTESLQLTFSQTSKWDIGVLGAAFYIPYVFMQIPVGALVDRFGPRHLLTFAVLVCGLSCLIFSNASVFSTTLISRALLGLCSATAFIGALKLITIWFKSSHLALLVGVTQALGMIGASFGAKMAFELAESLSGWRQLFELYGMVFFVLAVLIYCFIRNNPGKNYDEKSIRNNNNTPAGSIKTVFLNRYTWINAAFAGLIYAPTDILGELWGKEFIQNIHTISANQSATIISILFIGWGIGGPIAGMLADKFGRKNIMLISSLCGALLLPFIFYFPYHTEYSLMASVFVYGLTNTGLIASYALAGEMHSANNSGVSLAITNMFSVLLGAILMMVVGALLDMQSTMLDAIGGTYYTPESYRHTALILPLCALLAFGCALGLKNDKQ